MAFTTSTFDFNSFDEIFLLLYFYLNLNSLFWRTFHMLWKTRKNLTHLILTRFFYQQKADFPCIFIKANLSRTRNLLIVTYFSNYISNRLIFLLYENNQNSNSNSRTRSVFWVAKFILNITQPFHKTVKTWEKFIKNQFSKMVKSI